MPKFLLIALSLIYQNLSAQHSKINFLEIPLDQALEQAVTEKKLLLLDTYTDWCTPCKVLDATFEEMDVAKFFNENFVNVKVDLDKGSNKYISNKYGIVFLPTLLILDQYGKVIAKAENLLEKDELINFGHDAIKGNGGLSNVDLNPTPFSTLRNSESNNDIDPNSKEEIIYVYDSRASSGRPHIMYHEAYLHLQLMDGKHHAVVKKYLSTQNDWSSTKNVRFIFDFMHDVHSKQFEYFINNRKRFEDVIGKEDVDKSLSIIVNQRLERGFPQPTLQEARKLFGMLDSQSAEQRAYNYYLNRLIEHENDEEYIEVAKKYIEEINPYDHQIIYQMVKRLLSRSNAIEVANKCIDLMNQAIIYENSDHEYYFVLAQLYLKQDSIGKAYDAIKEALSLISKSHRKFQEYSDLKSRIESL